MRYKNKSAQYAHTLKPEIEKYVNKTQWEENTLEDIEHQSSLILTSQTTTPPMPKEKRPRKDTSLSVTEVSAEDFHLHSKKPKTIHTIPRSGEEDTQSAKGDKGEGTPIPSINYQTMSTSSSKKQTDTTVTTQPPQGLVKLSIFQKYDMIRKKNQMLTNNTYAQFWKQTSTTQHIFLSSFDTDKGRIHMAFLQAHVPHPKERLDYKRETLEFNTRDVHPSYWMDLHIQTK